MLEDWYLYKKYNYEHFAWDLWKSQKNQFNHKLIIQIKMDIKHIDEDYPEKDCISIECLITLTILLGL